MNGHALAQGLERRVAQAQKGPETVSDYRAGGRLQQTAANGLLRVTRDRYLLFVAVHEVWTGERTRKLDVMAVQSHAIDFRVRTSSRILQLLYSESQPPQALTAC